MNWALQNSITFVLFCLVSRLLLYCDQTFQLQRVSWIEAVLFPSIYNNFVTFWSCESVVTLHLAANGVIQADQQKSQRKRTLDRQDQHVIISHLNQVLSWVKMLNNQNHRALSRIEYDENFEGGDRTSQKWLVTSLLVLVTLVVTNAISFSLKTDGCELLKRF